MRSLILQSHCQDNAGDYHLSNFPTVVSWRAIIKQSHSPSRSHDSLRYKPRYIGRQTVTKVCNVVM